MPVSVDIYIYIFHLEQLLGSLQVAHLGPNQFLGRQTMRPPILLLPNPSVVQALLVPRLAVLYLVAHQLVYLEHHNLLHQRSVLRRHPLLEARCLVLERHRLHLLVVLRPLLVVRPLMNSINLLCLVSIVCNFQLKS